MELSKKDNDQIWHMCDTNPEYAVEMMTAIYDYLGVVSKEHFAELFELNLRTVQRKCNNGNIKTFNGNPIVKLYKINLKT